MGTVVADGVVVMMVIASVVVLIVVMVLIVVVLVIIVDRGGDCDCTTWRWSSRRVVVCRGCA